jgi:hypothetical protein
LWRPEEGEILVADRRLAARAPRFAVVYATVYRLPAFHRFHGAVFPIAQYRGFDAVGVMEAVIEHLKGPGPNEDRRGWLIANAGRVMEALTHTALARNQKTLELSDAVIGIANYNAAGDIDECVSKLDERDDVLRDEPGDEDFDAGFDEVWDWFKNPTIESGGGGHADVVIGRVLLGDGIWRLKASGAKNLAELRERFEKLMGPEVTFESQRLDDIRPQGLKLKPELAVTKLVESASSISLESSRPVQLKPGETTEDLQARMLADYDRKFLEDSIPALDGMTPRQAAASPTHRGKLIALMKERIRGLDERNLQTGRNDSIEWMVEELGLKEIGFPAPPARAIPAEYGEENDGDGLEEDDEFDDLPPAPRLPDGPLSGDEIAERLVKVGMTLDTPEEHIRALRRAGGTGTVDLEAALGDFLTEDEFSAGLMLVTKASFVMVPPGHRFPPVDMGRVYDELKEYVELLRRAKSPKAMLDPAPRSRQPTLVACMSVMLIDSPRNLMRLESAFTISAFLTAYTNELDRQLRSQGREG